MIFTQQLHQCHGLVNVGQNSLSVPVPGGAILLCITHVVCDCYLSSSPFACGWYQVVSSILSRSIGSFPWSLFMTAQNPTVKERQERNQVLKRSTFCATEICYFQLLILELHSSDLAVNNGLVNISPALTCSSHTRFVFGFLVRALLEKTNELAFL